MRPGQTDLPSATRGPQGQLGALVLQGAYRKSAGVWLLVVIMFGVLTMWVRFCWMSDFALDNGS